MHTLALRGSVRHLPREAREFEAAGLVCATPDGFTLTAAGHRCHRALLEEERARLDIGLLDILFERFGPIARRLDALESRWRASKPPARRKLVGELLAVVDELEPVLQRSGHVAPRFGAYIERLESARRCVLAGDLDRAFDDPVDSIRAVCGDVHEDYLQTLGEGYDELDV